MALCHYAIMPTMFLGRDLWFFKGGVKSGETNITLSLYEGFSSGRKVWTTVLFRGGGSITQQVGNSSCSDDVKIYQSSKSTKALDAYLS